MSSFLTEAEAEAEADVHVSIIVSALETTNAY